MKSTEGGNNPNIRNVFKGGRWLNRKSTSTQEASGLIGAWVGLGMMLRGHGGDRTKTSGARPSALKACCNLLFFFFEFDENHKITELKMIKIHFFFWPGSKYNFFFNSSHCFLQVCFVFLLNLFCFLKNQTAIETQRSRWWGGELGAALAHPLLSRHGAQLLLPGLGASASIRQDNSLNGAPWSLVGCCELGTQQHKASPSSRLAGCTFRNAMNARCCHPGIFQRCSVSRWWG